MPFLRIDIDAEGRDTAFIEDLCLTLGAVAVTLVDQHDDPVLEPAPGEVRLWPSTGIQALFAAEDSGALPDAEPLLSALRQQANLPAQCVAARVIEDRAWEREWLQDFRPMNFGARLWIVPTALTAPLEASVIVRLDPGLAFGTGTHATTAMCLRWLDAHVTDTTSSVIDFGCGSGILAIAALALGAQGAQAFDIDPQALLATGENALLNNVAERLHIAASTPDLHAADIVVANILAGPLADLSAELSRLVRPGGWLVLAGLLDTQAGELQRHYAAELQLQLADGQDGWTLLAGQRPAIAAQFRP
jgi:ribosomal protein L11 methyltransferase